MKLGGTNLLVEYNTIDSVGYIGMDFTGDTITIKNNVISNYCMTKDDGGGLYTWNNDSINFSRKLIGNIVFNAIGAPEGTGGNQVAAEGIYIDDRSANVDIIGNSVYKCGNSGIYIHNANHLNIHGNNIYDNGIQLIMRHDNAARTYPITNSVVDSNVFVSRDINQLVASFETVDNEVSDFGTFDYNSYCRPFDDDLTIHASGLSKNETITFDGWRLNYQKDQHSTKPPLPNFGNEKSTRKSYYSSVGTFQYSQEKGTYLTCRGPLFTECFNREDVEIPGVEASSAIIAPQYEAPGKPWVFRSDLVNWDATVDLALLALGYHIAKGAVPYNGDGPTVAQWNILYKYLTEQGFSKKTVMEGNGGASGEVYAWFGHWRYLH